MRRNNYDFFNEMRRRFFNNTEKAYRSLPLLDSRRPGTPQRRVARRRSHVCPAMDITLSWGIHYLEGGVEVVKKSGGYIPSFIRCSLQVILSILKPRKKACKVGIVSIVSGTV